jgi:Methylmalonyl-CoA mutase
VADLENTQRDQWEKTLKKELKLEDISSKTSKKQIEGGSWPTLSLSHEQELSLPVSEEWKKAAQTYVLLGDAILSEIEDDLKEGVRVFFFYQEHLPPQKWKEIQVLFSSHPDAQDIESFVIGHGDLLSGREAHLKGGHSVQELALLGRKIFFAQDLDLKLGVYVDSQFFKNIAKLRAAKLLAFKIFEAQKVSKKISLVALTSYREWTLYERYSNMLRNEAAVASSFIGGADFVQSSGYQNLLELETLAVDSAHRERSLRMGRNTSHILSLESMLGVVEDAAYGSYHLENLTQHYASGAWELLKKILPMSEQECENFFKEETSAVRETRQTQVRTRKSVLAGMNDFPDAKEKIEINLEPKAMGYRVSRDFEDLRIKVENLKKKPTIRVAILGDYGSLNARVNFVKNYFELLGLEVKETLDLSNPREDIIILCASDEDYPKLAIPDFKSEKFIAGKFEMPGYQNLFAGQNVYEVLEKVVSRWSHS